MEGAASVPSITIIIAFEPKKSLPKGPPFSALDLPKYPSRSRSKYR